MRLVWSKRGLADFERLAARAPAQATAVFEAMRWMADLDLSLGRPVAGTRQLYWPVPPQGVFYRVSSDRKALTVMAVRDARRRRRPW